MVSIANLFNVRSKVTYVAPYGAGHINQTYICVCEDNTKYIMQKINDKIFPDVASLMENICNVTNYIATKENGFAETLSVIYTKNNLPFLHLNGGYYRMYNFLSGETVETGATTKQFELAGYGFGRFQRLLDGYPAQKLHEPIKDFHNTQKRFNVFLQAVKDDCCGRKAECIKEIDFFINHKAYCTQILSLIKSNKLPLRVTHNDTKPNNVLVDEKRNLVTGVIDLDTVMPGSILYDFGDSIRYGTNTANEDETDLSKVKFSKEYYQAFCCGFLSQVKDRLTLCEKENLYLGAITMTYECGMRFLTDYLLGDVYFKIHRKNHNLDRCRTQIKLMEEMLNQIDFMKQTINSYL